MYRQGDILLIPVLNPPSWRQRRREKKARNQGVIIAEGEATGHHHRVTDKGAYAFRGPSSTTRFLSVPATGASLTHEEHNTLTLDPGVYEIRHQREYVAPAERVEAAPVTRRVYD